MTVEKSPAKGRRNLLKGVAAAAGAMTAPMVATAQTTTTLRFQSTWPAKDIFHEYALDFAKKVNDMTGGELKIEVLPAGAVVPAFGLLDAVSKGTLDGGHGVLVYHYGKQTALALWGSGPAFGMDANMLLSWHKYGGGKELLAKLYQSINAGVVSFPYGPMPTQPLGWFKKPITKVEDFKGLKFRTNGLAIDLFTAMGAAVNALPGGEIVPAMDRGVIDAFEFNNPTSDRRFGAQDVAKNYMMGSFHQAMEFFEIVFNKKKHDALPKDLQAILRDTHVLEVLDELDRDLVGLAPVKKRIQDIAALLVVSKARGQLGLEAAPPSLHMCFSGNPGTGKTTVAMRMAEILHRLGYCRRGHVVAVTRDDLVGQYIGHTAPKTKEVLKRAMGGVLFIDEAYYLYRPENEKDYGQEAIEILLQVMENQRDDLVVILAGYADRMERFFESNPGMKSRIAHHVDFPDYSNDELGEIAQRMLAGWNYRFDDGARRAFDEYIVLRRRQSHFANARSVRNALDRMRLRQALRLFESGAIVDAEALTTITESDVRASRHFQQAEAG